MSFRKELEALINKYSMENESDTPDFILAAFMLTCLHAFDAAVTEREKWYGRPPKTLHACLGLDGPLDTENGQPE